MNTTNVEPQNRDIETHLDVALQPFLTVRRLGALPFIRSLTSG